MPVTDVEREEAQTSVAGESVRRATTNVKAQGIGASFN
jgi:hypothetical protein